LGQLPIRRIYGERRSLQGYRGEEIVRFVWKTVGFVQLLGVEGGKEYSERYYIEGRKEEGGRLQDLWLGESEPRGLAWKINRNGGTSCFFVRKKKERQEERLGKLETWSTWHGSTS